MKRVAGRSMAAALLSGVLALGLLVFTVRYFGEGGDWAGFYTNSHIYSGGVLQNAIVCDRYGDALLELREGAASYAERESVRRGTLHAVGDAGRSIATGATAVFSGKLSGWDPLNGINGSGGNVTLSVDAELCAASYEALNGRNGTVGVVNYKTGEIICMVSSPGYDPANPPGTMPEGAYINRLLSASFVPGSVFKLVTAAAALETVDGINGWSFYCTGSHLVGGGNITCSSAHGELDLERALAVSCNCAFSELAVTMGSDTLSRYAAMYGFTDSFEIEGVGTFAGSLELEDITDHDLGWTGVGQGAALVNPAALLRFVSAIASGGTASDMRLTARPTYFSSVGSERLISASTASRLQSMMRYCVTLTYGEDSFPGLDICAKSGTAEVDGASPHAWFCGFLRDPEHPYAFVVLVENGGSGAAVAGAVANTVLQAAVADS